MPLTIAPLGRVSTIKKLIIDEKTKRHLKNLGVIVGATVVPISEGSGNIIIKVKDGRLALNKSLAMKIHVA